MRKSLINSNSARKYTLYAVGEIGLVVIGILIALQVNNWNIDRNNQSQESQILQQLKVEYEENLLELNRKNFMRLEMIKGIETLLYISDYGLDSHHLDSIDKLIHLTLVNPTFDPAVGVTNELLNSGKLYLIKNEDLKHHLTTWSGKINNLIEEEQSLVKVLSPDYWKYIRENYSYREMMQRRNLIDKFSNNIGYNDIDGDNYNYEIKANKKVSEYERFIDDPTIINYLQDIRFNLNLTIIQANSIKMKVENILSDID